MKKLILSLIISIVLTTCAYSKESKVFIYHIPDSAPKIEQENSKTNNTKDIISDDITADTSLENDEESDEEFYDISFDDEYEDEVNYNISDMYTDVLQGYAKYDENDENSIFLDEKASDYFKLNSDNTEFLKSKSLFDYQKTSLHSNQYHPLSRYSSEEYSIKEISGKSSTSYKGFSTGTTYSQSISYGELEKTSGIFSKYEYKNFAISTSFSKTVNTTNNNYNDNIYISPEFKINDYFSLKENLSTDIVKKKNKAELVLSINPFGKSDLDRLKFDLGASRTYNLSDDTFKSQIQFMTRFKF